MLTVASKLEDMFIDHVEDMSDCLMNRYFTEKMRNFCRAISSCEKPMDYIYEVGEWFLIRPTKEEMRSNDICDEMLYTIGMILVTRDWVANLQKSPQ